jgi:uncharacterized surface protein with fasciclin (FAS1) repeats
MNMKQTLRSLFFITALGVIVTTTSCKKDDPAPVPVPTPTPTVVGVAQSDTSFSILVAAVVKAGLASTLSGAGTFTVFAPTNNAFRAAGYANTTAFDAFTPGQVDTILKPILLYHVLGAKVLAAGVPASDTVKSLNGKNIFASKNANGVFVNGIKVTTPDLNASNGVVHVIGKLLIPPTKTIAQIVIADPNFSLLKTAVIRAGLAGALSGAGKYTVFAPVNSGFPASLDTDLEIDNAPVAAVLGIVGSHAFGTNIFAGDLVAGNTPATVNALTTLTIALSPASVKITGSANAVSLITATDIVATNGVIHIINKLLQ